MVVTDRKILLAGRNLRHLHAKRRRRGPREHAADDAVLLQVRVARRGRNRIDAMLGTLDRAGRDHIPRQIMTGEAPVFLQLLRGAGQRFAVHDSMEGVAQFGPRLQRPECAFLGSDARARPAGSPPPHASSVSAARYSDLGRIELTE